MKQTAITQAQNDPQALEALNDVMTQAGQVANQAAARGVFEDHLITKANNTERRKRADLALFETFLQSVGVPAIGLFADPRAWRGITWGLVKAFQSWQLKQGYAIASINGRLSTVRTYARLAAQSGAITEAESILIASVKGFAHKEAKHIDERRRAEGLQTRVGTKKTEAVSIPENIAQVLTTEQPDTPQGRRDALLMCLLLEHGLRVGEIAIMTRAAFDLKAGTVTVYRPKVDLTQTHTMTPATRTAAAVYLKHNAPVEGIIWRKSSKGTGKLSGQMSATSAPRALTKRVELLGRHAGIDGLSAHDGRHYWATYEANHGTPINRLQEAGGWSSMTMPARYIASAKIANDGTARVRAS
jgi:integrase